MVTLILDFSKKFDPHEHLMVKLKHYGIKEKTMEWIKSWLKKRTLSLVDQSQNQQLHVRSTSRNVLGPLIFLLYVNDKQEDLECTLTLFADDVLLYHRITCETATTALQRDLDELGSWAESWQMVYNPSKCYKMSVYRSKSPVLKDYKLFNQVLSSVQQHPDLGILLSDDLPGPQPEKK